MTEYVGDTPPRAWIALAMAFAIGVGLATLGARILWPAPCPQCPAKVTFVEIRNEGPTAYRHQIAPTGEVISIPMHEWPEGWDRKLPRRGKARAKGDGIADGREPGR